MTINFFNKELINYDHSVIMFNGEQDFPHANIKTPKFYYIGIDLHPSYYRKYYFKSKEVRDDVFSMITTAIQGGVDYVNITPDMEFSE